MKKRTLILAVAALSIASASEGQALRQRKPGLWEIQYMVESSDPKEKQAQAEMAERMKNMTPAERAQMEAYMNKSGMGMAVGPGGVPMMAMRVCVTPQDIADESGHSFMKGIGEKENCTSKVLTQSPTEVRMHAVCRGQGDTASEMDVRIYDIAADHYSLDLNGRGARGDMRMQQKARWLGADCKGK
jgi:hypothetical protein